MSEQPAEHRATVGWRTIRRLDGCLPQFPFARCRCGWNGEMRRDESDALKDATAHMEEMAPAPLPEPPVLGLAGGMYAANPYYYRLDGIEPECAP